GRRRADHGNDSLVGDELLRQRLCRCCTLLDRGVARDERDLEAVFRGQRLDRVLGPAELLVAEEARAARERSHDRDLELAVAVDCLARGHGIRTCAGGGCKRCGNGDRRRRADPSTSFHSDVPPWWCARTMTTCRRALLCRRLPVYRMRRGSEPSVW